MSELRVVHTEAVHWATWDPKQRARLLEILTERERQVHQGLRSPAREPERRLRDMLAQQARRLREKESRDAE